MQNEMQRLFFALWPEARARSALQVLAASLRGRIEARWTRPENLHMTLAFLGNVEPERRQALSEAAGEVADQGFRLTLDRLEYWRKADVLCLTSSTPCEPLRELADGLAARLRAVGFTLEKRPFRAHLTLARKARRVPLDLPELTPLCWSASRFVLVESRLERGGGSAYAILQAWPLTAEKSAKRDGLGPSNV